MSNICKLSDDKKGQNKRTLAIIKRDQRHDMIKPNLK